MSERMNPWTPEFYMTNTESEIEHSGVKGMKWGVRNDKKVKLTPEEKDKKKETCSNSKSIDQRGTCRTFKIATASI